MTAKHNLKIIEPIPGNELSAAEAAAAEASSELAAAETNFAARYPGEHRLFGLMEEWRPERVAFYDDRNRVIALRDTAHAARRAVDQARARIAASATEKEKRADLAAAIAKAKAADAAAQNLRAAVTRAEATIVEAERIHDDAAKALIVATDAHAKAYEAAIEQGHPVGRDSSVRDARRAKDEAADELTSARAAATAIKAKLQDAERKLREARATVETCARNVATSAIPKLLEETLTTHAELEARRQVLLLLAQWSGGPGSEAIDGYTSSIPFGFEQSGGDPGDHHATAPWSAALAALTRDAGAPLPKI